MEFIYSPIFVSIFFSVAVGLFVPFWYWHWLNKVSTPPLLFSPSCNKNIISFIFPRTLNYWLLIAPIERWSDDPTHSTLDDLSLTKVYFSRTPYLPFFFVQRGPQIRLCVSLIDRRQLRRTSHANLLMVAIWKYTIIFKTIFRLLTEYITMENLQDYLPI